MTRSRAHSDDDLNGSLDLSALKKSKKNMKKGSARDKKRDLENRFSTSHSPESRAWHDSNNNNSSSNHNSSGFGFSNSWNPDLNGDGRKQVPKKETRRGKKKETKTTTKKLHKSEDLTSYLRSQSPLTNKKASTSSSRHSRQSMQSSPGPGTKTDLHKFLNDTGISPAKRRRSTDRQSVQSSPEPRRVVPMSCLLYTSPSPRD